MSAKKTIFPTGRGTPAEQPSADVFDELYTGHPGYNGHGAESANEAEAAQKNKGAAKGHAAYAAQDAPGQRGADFDSMPPFEPRGKGLGPLGGLFADDAAAPPGHGAREAEDRRQGPSPEELRDICRISICPDCPVKKEADDARLRALAELDNAKKRLTREHEEQARFAAESVLADLLPSLDNLDLALQHAGNAEACKDFVTGVRMTRKLLGDSLVKHGLVQTGERGEEFNPAVHEAVGMVHDPEIPENHVCALLSSGYKLHERLLRPARVMVCKKS